MRHLAGALKFVNFEWNISRWWIGRDGPIPWPPRSPDITQLDFFLWGYVKDIVYRTKVRDTNDLQHRIIEASDTVTVDMLARTWQEIEYRYCRGVQVYT